MLLLKHIFHDFSAFEQLSISNVKMSEGTFCHVEVHIISCHYAIVEHTTVFVNIAIVTFE